MWPRSMRIAVRHRERTPRQNRRQLLRLPRKVRPRHRLPPRRRRLRPSKPLKQCWMCVSRTLTSLSKPGSGLIIKPRTNLSWTPKFISRSIRRAACPMRRPMVNLKCGFRCTLMATPIFLASSQAVPQGTTVPGLKSSMAKRSGKAISKRLAWSSSIGSPVKAMKVTSPWTFWPAETSMAFMASL